MITKTVAEFKDDAERAREEEDFWQTYGIIIQNQLEMWCVEYSNGAGILAGLQRTEMENGFETRARVRYADGKKEYCRGTLKATSLADAIAEMRKKYQIFLTSTQRRLSLRSSNIYTTARMSRGRNFFENRNGKG